MNRNSNRSEIDKIQQKFTLKFTVKTKLLDIILKIKSELVAYKVSRWSYEKHGLKLSFEIPICTNN